MKDILMSCLIFGYYISCFGIFGTVALKKMHINNSLPLALITGCFSYYLCFNILALYMKIHFFPLSELALVWFSFVGIMAVFLIWKYHSVLKEVIINCIKVLKDKPWFYGGLFILIIVQYAYIGSQTALVSGVTDDLYYIGDVVRSVYTDTIQQFDYLSGEKYSQLIISYFLQMYPVHSAAICKLTGIHPLIENKWVLTGNWLILINSVYYLWGRLLFKESEKKITGMFICVTWIVFTQKMVTESFAQHLIYRMAEGKNLLMNLIIPFMLYLFFRIVDSNGAKENWKLLFLTVTSSYCFVMSSMFVLPFVLGSFFACYILLGRYWEMIFPAFMCCLPCLAVICNYVLMTKGVISFPVP